MQTATTRGGVRGVTRNKPRTDPHNPGESEFIRARFNNLNYSTATSEIAGMRPQHFRGHGMWAFDPRGYKMRTLYGAILSSIIIASSIASSISCTTALDLALVSSCT